MLPLDHFRVLSRPHPFVPLSRGFVSFRARMALARDRWTGGIECCGKELLP